MADSNEEKNTEETSSVSRMTEILKEPDDRRRHSGRRHRRRCSRWQKITWIILAVILAIGGAVIFMVDQIPMKYRSAAVILLAAFIVVAGIWSFHRYHHKGRRAVITVNVVLIALNILIGVFGVFAYRDFRTMKPEAVQLKNDLGAVMTNIQNEDMNSASASLEAVKNDNSSLKKTLSHPVWKIAEKVPVVGKQVQSVDTVTDVVDEASDQVITPLINLMNTQPFSQLKVGDDGFNVTLINSYLDFLDQTKPTLTDMNNKIQRLDLSLTGEQDTVDEYKQKFSDIMNASDKYMPLFRIILGDGTNRNYLFVAQNLAEGRTNGGFPGSASIMRISDGVLRIDDFQSIYKLIPSPAAPSDVAQTGEEVTLFDNKMVNNWDANYTPDFQRAGQIWTRSYEDQSGEKLNGVISMTPNVIQDALQIFNTNITLSDGTVMDGTNAAKTLGYDLYYKYLGGSSGYTDGNDISDALFSETASRAEDVLTGNISVGNFQKYSQLLDKEMKDGTFLVWMSDPKEEETAVDAGISGILTDGKTQNGDTGFYWSFDSACKMGWFMDLQSSVGQAVVNSDGTYTYPVTITMKNTISSDDIANGSNYILGNYAGRLQGQMHIFAPLGGKISDVKTDNGTEVTEATYENLQLFYNNMTVVEPGKTMKVTYNVTLPKGVKDINLKVTPNYNNYR